MDTNGNKAQDPTGIQIETPGAQVDIDQCDYGNPHAPSGANLKNRKNPNLKFKSTKLAQTAAGTFRSGTQLLLIHTVPETARSKIEPKPAAIIGFSVIVILLAALTAQIIYYGQCRSQPVLVASSTVERCTSSSFNRSVCSMKSKRQSKNYKNCKVQLLQHDDELVIDKQGTWQVHPNFRYAESIWKVAFNNYTASETKFRDDFQNITSMLHDLLAANKGKRWYEVLHAIRYREISAEGVSGFMKLTANVNLGVLIGNKLRDWGQMRSIPSFVKGLKNLPRAPEDLRLLSSTRWYSPQGCDETVTRHGYNHLAMRQKRAVATFDYQSFGVNAKNQFVVERRVKPPTSSNCTDELLPFEINIDGGRLGIPVLEDIVASPGRQDVFTLEFDTGQVFVVDWCNANWERCLETVCDIKRKVAPDNATSACITNRLLDLGSTERFRTMYSHGLDLLGFVWRTGSSKGSTGKPKEYFVVPELIPDQDCVDCQSIRNLSIDCQAFLGIELHYFLLKDDDNDADEYITTFEWNLQLDGSLNDFNARAAFHCDTTDLRFVKEPKALAADIRIPFDLTKGTAECDLQICRTWLERLSLSIANVVLLYTILSVATIMGVMYLTGRKVASGEQIPGLNGQHESGKEPLVKQPPVETSDAPRVRFG